MNTLYFAFSTKHLSSAVLYFILCSLVIVKTKNEPKKLEKEYRERTGLQFQTLQRKRDEAEHFMWNTIELD